MATQLSIVNGVLNQLGEIAVSNVNDNDHAKIIDEKIDLIYRDSLSVTNWFFAEIFTPLAKTTDTGIPNLQFVYQLPFDFERLIEVDRIKNWRLLKDKFYTDRKQDVNIFYISNQIAFDLWPSSFERYIIFKTAADTSLVITNNIKLTEYLSQELTKRLSEAVSDNANDAGFIERVNNKYDRRIEVF